MEKNPPSLGISRHLELLPLPLGAVVACTPHENPSLGSNANTWKGRGGQCLVRVSLRPVAPKIIWVPMISCQCTKRQHWEDSVGNIAAVGPAHLSAPIPPSLFSQAPRSPMDFTRRPRRALWNRTQTRVVTFPFPLFSFPRLFRVGKGESTSCSQEVFKAVQVAFTNVSMSPE